MAATPHSRTPTFSPSTTTPDIRPVSVLFVCLGNICRSPMAEGVFRSLTHFSTPTQHPQISYLDSCGTIAYHAGDQPDPRTLSVLSSHANIRDYRHQARRVRVPSDFVEFDYIIAMDEENLLDLRDMVKREKKKGVLNGEEVRKCFLFGEFGGKDEGEEVQDPYYGGADGFEIAFEQVERCGKGLLAHIEAEAGKGKNEGCD